ncbi:rifin [Plasmodium reichenowi]|uniref:Rifin n=1 Tax=Plasmodium reichenowi TaxID=5854 RepID=A0A060RQU4_PLARE|nr:rifin [Plasmodium reichenowi]
MKVHYINILLFAHALNILVNTHKKTSITHHTQTNRSLCECDLYIPNYNNDQQMKEVMQQFEYRTSQRLRDYDERMIEKRKQCKEKCDKESQKIILKDKLEKELMNKFSTLDTDIQSDAIPTCVCEKSIADKVEKGCLRCGEILGAALPELGSIGGTALYALNTWKDAAIVTATAAAKQAGIAAGESVRIPAGKEFVIKALKHLYIDKLVPNICEEISSASHYNELTSFAKTIVAQRGAKCGAEKSSLSEDMCRQINISLRTKHVDGTNYLPDDEGVQQTLNSILDKAETTAKGAAEVAEADVAAEITKEQTALIEGGFNSTISSINAAIIAIEVIVLVMVIIYLILRYRRKKKMKKKLQYIKLLEE